MFRSQFRNVGESESFPRLLEEAVIHNKHSEHQVSAQDFRILYGSFIVVPHSLQGQFELVDALLAKRGSEEEEDTKEFAIAEERPFGVTSEVLLIAQLQKQGLHIVGCHPESIPLHHIQVLPRRSLVLLLGSGLSPNRNPAVAFGISVTLLSPIPLTHFHLVVIHLGVSMALKVDHCEKTHTRPSWDLLDWIDPPSLHCQRLGFGDEGIDTQDIAGTLVPSLANHTLKILILLPLLNDHHHILECILGSQISFLSLVLEPGSFRCLSLLPFLLEIGSHNILRSGG